MMIACNRQSSIQYLQGFPKEIKTAFSGFEEDYVCSVVNLPFSGGSVRFILFGQDKYYVFEVKDKFVLLPVRLLFC